MAGIVSYGAYIPIHRLPRELMAKAWGTRSSGGERSVANYDEDSLTMAVEAAFDCLQGHDKKKTGGLFFASTTSPYKEKQSAVLAARTVDLGQEIVTADFAGTLRAGTTALGAALDTVLAKRQDNILVTAADVRLGYPNSDAEQAFGDAAASLLIGNSLVIAEIEARLSLADEITDVWRTDEDTFVRSWEDRWVIGHGYTKNIQDAVNTLLQRAKLKAADFAKAIFSAPDARSYQALGQSLGFTAAQLQEPLLSSIGNTGSAHPLLLLVAALETAKPGDRLLLAGYGDGCDAFILRVTPEIEKVKGKKGVKGHLASRRTLATYEKYLAYRRLLSWPEKEPLRLFPAATAMWRDRPSVLSLHGSRCRKCGTISFPIQRVCYECQSVDDYDEAPLAGKLGKLFTYCLDNLAGGLEPPTVQSIVDMDGGGRIYCLMTDNDPNQVKVEMPLEMTFRRLYEGAGFHNYFWKCRPVR